MPAFQGWNVEILKVRRYRAGYEVRTEMVGSEGNPAIEMRNAYTSDGHYIGDPRWAYRLAKRGIVPELRTPTNNVCSIGFCEKEQKWYGWSHRAIWGFGVGYVVKDGDAFDGAYEPGFAASTLDDCKALASAFADAVS